MDDGRWTMDGSNIVYRRWNQIRISAMLC